MTSACSSCPITLQVRTTSAGTLGQPGDDNIVVAPPHPTPLSRPSRSVTAPALRASAGPWQAAAYSVLGMHLVCRFISPPVYIPLALPSWLLGLHLAESMYGDRWTPTVSEMKSASEKKSTLLRLRCQPACPMGMKSTTHATTTPASAAAETIGQPTNLAAACASPVSARARAAKVPPDAGRRSARLVLVGIN